MSSRTVTSVYIGKPSRPAAKSILRNLQKTDRNLYPVFYEGEDVTPKPLNPLSFKGPRERQISTLNIVKESSDAGNQDFSSTACLNASQTLQSRYSTEHQFQSCFEGGGSTLQDTIMSLGLEEFNQPRNIISSDFEIKPPSVQGKTMPSKIDLLLVETPTFSIFELVSTTVDKDSEEGNDHIAHKC